MEVDRDALFLTGYPNSSAPEIFTNLDIVQNLTVTNCAIGFVIRSNQVVKFFNIDDYGNGLDCFTLITNYSGDVWWQNISLSGADDTTAFMGGDAVARWHMENVRGSNVGKYWIRLADPLNVCSGNWFLQNCYFSISKCVWFSWFTVGR